MVAVVLPRECTGAEVLEAFRKAAAFELSPTERWVIVVDEKKVRYEPGSVRRIVEVASAEVSREIFVRTGLLRRRWFKTNMAISLPETACEKGYTKIEINDRFPCPREMLEAFLERFYAELTPKAA